MILFIHSVVKAILRWAHCLHQLLKLIDGLDSLKVIEFPVDKIDIGGLIIPSSVVRFLRNLWHQGPVNARKHQLLENSLLLFLEHFLRSRPVIFIVMFNIDIFNILNAFEARNYWNIVVKKPFDSL